MCRNIKTLFNFDPPANNLEIQEASLQYVRKISGFNKPSKINTAIFNQTIREISGATRKLINTLETSAPPRNRKLETEHARTRTAMRLNLDSKS